MGHPKPLASRGHHAPRIPYSGSGANDIDNGLANASGVDAVASAEPGATAAEVPSTSPQDQLYLQQDGDTAAIAYTDIHQGGFGDCHLLAPLGEIAMQRPSFIRDMIATNPDGTETVRLYEAADGKLPDFSTTAFKPVSETVSNAFDPKSVNNQAGQDSQGNVHEIWPQVLEKACAQLEGGYGNIDHGGWPALAMEELTGQQASFIGSADVTAPMLHADVAAHDLIVLDTATADPTYNLIGGHGYMVKGLVDGSSGLEVACANPWGSDQPSLVPVAQFSQAFSGMNVGTL